MFRSRSCVIGRGVATFSICSAIALASKMPTQIGSTRSPILVLQDHDRHVGDRVDHQPLDGHLDQHAPLPSSLARLIPRASPPQTVGPGRAGSGPGLFVRSIRRVATAAAGSGVSLEAEIHDGIAAGASRDLPSRAAGSPSPSARRRRRSDSLLVQPASGSPAAAPAAPRSARVFSSSVTSSGSRFDRERVRPRRILEREHAVVLRRLGQRQRLARSPPPSRPGSQRSYRSIASTPGMVSRIRADQLEVLLARVAPPHRAEHARRAGLHRQVQVLADLRQIAHRPRSGACRYAADAGSRSGSARRRAPR